ncbi:MAG TPA: hypothetical protein PLH93_06150, partial [Flavobacteriales bacterium]|nr:hypothetical protein [Flavobacteriales bacterium]
MADTLRLHVGRARFAPCLVALLIAAAPALSTAQGPVWNWARTLDAGNGEFIRDVVVEPTTGDIYVVGAYQASTAAAAPYGLPPSVNGSVDAFIAKLDPSGDLLWNRAIGSVQSDAALGVAVAASGEVAVTGSYGASIPGLSLTHSGGQDAFVILYDNSGAVLWTKSVRSTQYDEGTGVAISGNLVVAYGTYTQSGLASGVPPLPGLTNGRRYAYLNTYSLSGTAGWSLTGGSNDHIRSERIATDGTNVHVVGGTDGSSFGWLNNLGLSLNAVSAANNDGLFISSVSLTGSVTWSQMIDNPGGDNVECNGVAVDCSAVYITGRTHDGSTFPGGVTRTVGQHDYWFLASMNRSTGITSWVRTASSTSAHGITGYDIAVGRNGQVHVAGSMAGTVTTDAGLVIAGPNDADLWVSRFDRDGTPIWSDRQLSTGDEAALAIASIGGGSFAIGGWFENDLTLGSASYPGANGSNLFTASFTDPGWASFANNPARFARPDPVCLSSGPVDLNAYLLAHADTAVAFLNVVSPQEATGAPNSVGAFFTTAGGWLVLDLRDTLPIGEAMNLTWRSQTDLVQARMLVSTSVDAVNWTTPATYTTSSSTYGISNHMLGASARYIRVARHGTLGTGFHLDAVRFLGSATTGGTWSGGAHVTAAGIFSPGAAGSYPVTYTVVQGPCTFSYSRTIVVNAPAIGGTIAGGGTYCPGSSGTLTLSGHSGAILRWERSTNGSTWFPISNTTTTETWSGITGTMHLRVVVDGGGVCGTTVSSTATLIVEDVTPPVVACPADDTLYVASASCTAPYAMPLIASTDDCMGVLPGGPVQITVAGGGQVAVNGIPVQADLDLSLIAGSIIDLPLGANQFIDTIIDGNGNMTVCAWAITVLDTIPPEITCPSTIELPAGVSCKAVLPDINGMVITLNDNCTGPLAIGQDIPTGTNVVGGEVVHLIATDPSGNV